MLILFCIGFCIFGPQVLLVGTLPVDLARRGTAAAAAGFVNFMGYMGAAAGDKMTGPSGPGLRLAVRGPVLGGVRLRRARWSSRFLWNAGGRPRLDNASEGQ